MAELVDALVLGTSANGVGVRVPSSAPMTFLFELNLTARYKYPFLKGWYFFCKIGIPKERIVLEMKIIKDELEFE